ncbi:MAG: hypothetical protein J5684_00515 [Eubacterium sp.]|nr:hypothetical protein [Eubacterium sp.]
MARNKMKKYKFSDEVMAKDAIISLVFGIVAFLCILFAVVYAFIMHGNAPDTVGSVLLAGLVSDITALIFAFLAFKDTEGGVLGKRAAFTVVLVNAALLVAIYML